MKQLDLGLPKGRGGKRKGAGRPNRSGMTGHLRRPKLDPRHPIHVTLKLAPGLPSLRRKDIFKMLRASVRKARQSGFAVAHFAILANHVHLILEPQSASVSRLFKSLEISFAKRVNSALKRRGAVFRGRYHVHVLATPTETRRALAYVLTNEAKHRGSDTFVRIDPYSSAYGYFALPDLIGRRIKIEFSAWSEDLIESWLGEILKPPHTWLLKSGWRRGRL